MDIQYFAIDPRPVSKEAEINKINQLKEENFYMLGLEVTIPEFANLMDENIDPQHTDRNFEKSCISVVFERTKNDTIFPIPVPKKIVLFTVRPDMDSVGSMALILTYLGTDSCWMEYSQPEEQVLEIAKADCFISEKKWQPKKLFQNGFETEKLGPIAKAVSDFSVELKQRVHWVYDWLYDYSEPAGYRSKFENEREEIRNAFKTGQTTIEVKGKIAIVISKLRAATSIGYSQAPVVVALNPEMPSPTGAYRKFTICQYSPNYCDISSVLKELAEIENGWGGSPVIGGSPQGISSNLEMNEVISVVQKHMI